MDRDIPNPDKGANRQSGGAMPAKPLELRSDLREVAPPQGAVPPPPPPAIPQHEMVLRSGDIRRMQKQQSSPARGSRRAYNDKKYDEVYRYVQQPQEASYRPFPASVAPAVVDLLTMQGKRTPYSHQAEVAHYVLDEGMNVSLRTPTASGKTVCFLAPTLTILHDNPKAVAVMLYPVNALAADQSKNLVDLGFEPDQNQPCIVRKRLGDRDIVAGLLNGDTPEGARKIIREQANLVLTNPVALHTSILASANHAYRDGSSWGRILSNIELVVMDEAHIMTGVQGTQTALAFRRLQAIADARSGKGFQAILASATIGNPREHAQALTGMGNWASVDKSGAKTQERTVVVLNPAEHPAGDGRWSPSVIIENLALDEYLAGRPTIIFCPSRNTTERLADRINDAAGKDVCLAFHSGLPPETKREATARVLRGQVPVVTATSALEVGVDIGSMQTCILYGHPGDFAAFNQRIGRVGRTTPGTVYVVLDENQNAVNSYLQANPRALNGAPEARTVYPENRKLATKHAACAYLETGGKMDIVKAHFPQVDVREAMRMARNLPHANINMIGGLGDFGQFTAVDPGGRELQRLGGQDAMLNWHHGAVIRSAMGKSFVVSNVDLGTMRVATEEMPEGVSRIYTTPKKERTIVVQNPEPLVLDDQKLAGLVSVISGDFSVSQQTASYRQFIYEKGESKPFKQDIALEPERRNPAIAFDTRGIELVLDRSNALAEALLGLSDEDKLYDALADVMRKTLPLVVQARPEDVELVIRPDGVGLVKFSFFDVADGGMGWSEAAIHRFKDWVEAAATLLKRCTCGGQGCPKCTLVSVSSEDRRDLADSALLAGRR